MVPVVSGCILALAIAMGIGRFAFTPLLPAMQAEAGLAVDAAGLLASLNYVGYLLGAVAAGLAPRGARRTAAFRVSLVVSVLTTACMGTTTDVTAWAVLRFLSGVASAGIFILGLAMALDALGRLGRESLSGWIYTGVGLGIAGSGVFAATAGGALNWSGEWIALGGVCGVLAVVPWATLTDPVETPAAAPVAGVPAASDAASTAPLVLLTLAYLLEGGGYIITGTFLVAMLKSDPATAPVGEAAWIVAGIAAAPSTLFWSAAGRRLGLWRALILAHAAQAIGIVLPLAGGAAAGLGSAFLFGGTFVGIVGLTFAIGRTLSGGASARVIGALTSVYGVGQILGPLPAGIVVERTGSYAVALAAAAAAVALGAALLAAAALLTTAHRTPSRPCAAAPR